MFPYLLFSYDRSLSSFITDGTLFLAMTLALHISFIANVSPFTFLLSTLHTFPKPPLPIGNKKLKWAFVISIENKENLLISCKDF